jgi:hypothetical protein
MILDAGLLFTGGPSGVAPPGTTLKIADNVLANASTSNQYIDLALGQTSTAGVNPVGGLPPATQVPIGVGPNVQPFRDIGIGDDPAMKILIQPIGTGWTGATSLAVNLQASPDNGSGAPAGFVTYYSSTAVTTANLNLGQRLMDMDMPRPPAGIAEPRFLQLSYTVAGGPFTGTANYLVGTLVLDRADQVYNTTNNAIWGGYPAGVVVPN